MTCLFCGRGRFGGWGSKEPPGPSIKEIVSEHKPLMFSRPRRCDDPFAAGNRSFVGVKEQMEGQDGQAAPAFCLIDWF